jgi:tetratricopeptide (TPR) repeat protein
VVEPLSHPWQHRIRRLAPLGLLSLALAALSPLPSPAPHGFGAAEVPAARAALASLPGAVRLFRAGSYDEAARLFQGALSHLPGPGEAAAAAAFLGLGEPAAYRRLLSGLHNNLGTCHLRARRYDLAIASFERSVAAGPSEPGPRVGLGLALMHRRRYGAARRSFEEALALGAGGDKLQLDLGRTLLRAGDREAARRALSRAALLSRRSGDVQSWGTALEAERLLAEADQEEGLLTAAERRLRRILARAPGDPQARYRLSQVLLRGGRSEEAAEHLRRFQRDARTLASIQSALAASPGRVAALGWVADTYRALGLLHLADVHYRQLLARNPEDRRARWALHVIRARAAASGLGDEQEINP